MPLVLKNFDQFTAEMVDTYVAFVAVNFPGIVPNFTSGSPTLALFQAVALEDLFLQSQINIVALMSRLSTSGSGPGESGSSADVDSFVNDFGLTRLPATLDEGQETFATNFTNTFDVLIPPGVVVETPDTTIQYQTIVDTQNPNWSPSKNAYVLPAGQTSITCTVQAVVAGTSQNVQPNSLVTLVNSIQGISFVTNLNPIENATNAETDQALKKRFVLYIQSLARATEAAIDFAVESVPGVVRFVLLENIDPAGHMHLGFFTVYVDDGTGSPPSPLLNAVANAVNAYRAFTVQFAVEPPNIVNINLTVTVKRDPNSTATNSEIIAEIQEGVFEYINTLGFGKTLFYTKMYDVIFDSTQGNTPGPSVPEDIESITSLLINSATVDVPVANNAIPLISIPNISVTVIP